eukprot:m.145564 g.145564  ORF g.145564 m.145564 type:complete len:151 (+) comp17738_c0_seq4:538-990(+)
MTHPSYYFSSRVSSCEFYQGVFAAVAALMGKLASGGFEPKAEGIASVTLAHLLPSPDDSIFVRISYLGLLVASNVAMWASFSKALALSASSQEPQGINTAANLLTSGCLGLVVFGEQLPVLWWGGMALITIGIILVRRDAASNKVAGKEN